MKSLIVSATLLLTLTNLFLSCTNGNQPDDPNGQDSSLRTSEGAEKILQSYQQLFSNPCKKVNPFADTVYSSWSTMPASQFGPGLTYPVKGVVAFISEYKAAIGDTTLCNIWDYDKSTYDNTCYSGNIPWPYDTTNNKTTTEDEFWVNFVPDTVFKRYKGPPYFNYLTRLSHLKFAEIKSLESFALEPKDGYAAKTYPVQYLDSSSCLGITCKLKLKTGAVVNCYLTTVDLLANTNHHVIWKRRDPHMP